MRAGLKYPPDARVFVLHTDPDDYTKKTFIRYKGFDTVSSNLSINGVGSATVNFPNKDLMYLDGVTRPEWADVNHAEVTTLKEAFLKFETESSDFNVQIPKSYFLSDKLLLPRVPPFDLIWIDYRGRNGKWYAGFSGVVTGYKETIRPDSTPGFAIMAKDLRRLLQFTPIVTGLNNLAGVSSLANLLTNFQEGSPAVENVFATKSSPAAIIDDVLATVNQMLRMSGTEVVGETGPEQPAQSFWEVDIFDKFAEYVYGSNTWFSPFHERDANDSEEGEYYRSPLGNAYYDSIFNIDEDNTSVYQFLIRSQLGLFTIDTQNALNILNQVAQATLSFIYIDQAGNLRYEYPRYATIPSLENDYKAPGLSNGSPDNQTLWNAINYWVNSRDEMFLNYSGGEDESEVVATRVIATQNHALMQQQAEALNVLAYDGYATAPELDLLKYGLRDARVSPFYAEGFFIKKEVMDAYAQSLMLYLNSQAKSFTVTLKQRPDTMLNRSMVFADRGRVGLITAIADTYSETGGHTRTHTCQYARFLGEFIEYPWANILPDTISLQAMEEATVPVVPNVE